VTGKTRQQRSSSRAAGDAALHRRMRQQSLKTSWRMLAEACEHLIEWRSFALWVRAIVAVEGFLPPWLREALGQRCPGILESTSNADDSHSIWLDLSVWIDERVFSSASASGWIDALHYYCGRDPRSEQIWRYWERTEDVWREQKPPRYPTFDEWHHDALTSSPANAEIADEVARYVEWEAFTFWTRLMVERRSELPEEVKGIIEQRCPGFLNHIRNKQPSDVEYSTWLWRRMLAWIETHVFADTIKLSSLNAVRDAARTHLRGERIAEYWVACSARWQKSAPTPCPGFERWLQDADLFVTE
jgi:hypothetical protein